jgi:hypothetical protein
VRVESPAFTEREMRSFLDEVTDHERRHLIGRVQAASARLGALFEGPHPTLPRERGRDESVSTHPALPRERGRETDSWNGHDVLVHIAVLSKFYGMLAYQVGSGKVSNVELLEYVRARDVAGEQLSSQSDNELLTTIQQDHQRTITYLESADSEALHRRATLYEGFSMSALELALLGLCSHLEIHIDQLERTRRP